jgi:hypothetical protein
MKCGACILTPVLAILGLGVLGVGGYNFATTGCPLGSCESKSSNVTQVSNAAGKADECCALGATLVADKSEACTEKAASECSTGTDCGSCPDAGVCPFKNEKNADGTVVQASQKAEGHCPSSGSCPTTGSCPETKQAEKKAEEKKTAGAN